MAETLPSGTNTKLSFSFDNADQLKQIVVGRSTGTNPFRWTFGYGRDPLGQVTGSTDRESGMRHGYSYDSLNRLTQDLRANRTAASWTYDATNNLRTVQDTASNTTKTLTYDANYNQLSGMQTTGGVSQNLGFSYNGNGDRTTTTDLSTNATINSYGYNQANQLTSFTQGSTSATYAYDGDGLRTSKTVNGSPEAFTWDIAEGMPVIIQDGSTKYITGPDGLPLEQIDGSGNVLYYVQDQLGSTRGLIDGSGNVQGTYTYGAYGDLAGRGGTASAPFGYAGQYTDAESGLMYMRARYYDLATAQFTSVDPLSAYTGATYAYAGGDALNLVDPAGLCAAATSNTPPPLQDKPCIGTTFIGEHGAATVQFTRDERKYGKFIKPAEKLGWDFLFTSAYKAKVRAVGKETVVVWQDEASVDGKRINPPYAYSDHHVQTLDYNFHGSFPDRYQYIGRKGGGALKEGETLYLHWVWKGAVAGPKEHGYFSGFFEVRCKVN